MPGLDAAGLDASRAGVREKGQEGRAGGEGLVGHHHAPIPLRASPHRQSRLKADERVPHGLQPQPVSTGQPTQEHIGHSMPNVWRP